jgi:hypothetical protein
MDRSPGSHRPLEVQQPSSRQFPFTGPECDFFQLGGFHVQMAADHAAKSQRQRRGRGIDEANCSSLKHHSSNDRRKRVDAQHWRSTFGVWRLAFGVWRLAQGAVLRWIGSGRDDYFAVDQTIGGCKDSPVRSCHFRHPKVPRATYASVGEKCCFYLGVDFFRVDGTCA